MSDNGPYIAVAAICEKILVEKSDLLSCIRIVDKVHVVVPPSLPDPLPRIPVQVNALIALRSGGFVGKKMIQLNLINPAGDSTASMESFPAVFDGGETGINLVLELTLHIQTEGVYTFDVLLDGELITRIPQRITISRNPPSENLPGNWQKIQP